MGVLKSASSMSAGVFLSRILGLVREQVFAYFFGASHAADAFQIAFRIPNLLRDLLAEGAMNSALVPTYVQYRESEGKRRAWQVAGRVFRALFVITLFCVGFGLFFTESLVSLYAAAYQDVPGKFELTQNLTKILFFFLPFVTLAAAFMGILNANGVYFIPAFASAAFNATSILTGVAFIFLVPQWGYPPIVGMALGMVVGGLVQALVQIPSLKKVGYAYPPKQTSDPPWHHDPALKRMLFLILPGLVGLAATQINILVNSILATGEGEGAVAWLNYAFRLMQFPIGVFGVSLAAAFLPLMSEAWVKRKPKELKSNLEKSIISALAINLPAAAGLGFLSVPIIQLIFEYGEFSHSDTEATALALSAYCLGLPFYSLVKILVPLCYAFERTRFAVGASVLSVALNVALNFWLIDLVGYWGLALGTSITAFIQALILFLFVHHLVVSSWLSDLVGRVARKFMLHLSIALGMGLVCYWTWKEIILPFGFSYFSEWGVLCRVFSVGLLVVEGVLVVYLVARLVGISETLEFFHLIRRKATEKPSP